MDQTKDADAAVAAGVADETPAPAVAPAAATVTTTTETETETKPTENPVETSQPVAKAEDDESDWEELDGEWRIVAVFFQGGRLRGKKRTAVGLVDWMSSNYLHVAAKSGIKNKTY